ncbi:cytochrome P450 [Amylostereum chailletii]|nr:cytochrome P450 [Amylostereum chailletii]
MAVPSLDSSSMAIASGVAGITSWVVLNRKPIPGDYALLLYFACVLALYSYLYVSHPPEAFYLTSRLTTLYFTSLASTTLIYRVSPFHPLAAYPGPLLWRLSSLVLVVVSYHGHRHLILDDLHKKYGPFVRIGPNALSVNSPSASNVIYGAAHHMVKSDSYRFPDRIPGAALFFKHSREDHAKRKQIWTQGFTGAAVENFFPPLEKRTWELTHCIERRTDAAGLVNLVECICHWSYDFMGEMVFGGANNLELMRDGDPRGLVQGGKQATAVLDSFGQAPWLFDLIQHIPSQSMQRLRKIAAEMMRTRYHADMKDVKIRDLSSYLIEGDQRTGEQIPLADLEVDAIVAIQGGSDNTGTTMALAVFFMLSYPPTYQKLQAILDVAFPDPTAPLDKQTLASIPLLDAVLTEALRLGSPFFLPRIVPPGHAVIDGKLIPEGTTVALAAYSQQVSEDNFFPEPLLDQKVIPSGEVRVSKPISAEHSMFIRYMLGPYVCVAKSFAMQEMRLCLSRLILTFDMSLPPGFNSAAFYKGLRNMRTTMLDLPLFVKAVRRKGKDTPIFT